MARTLNKLTLLTAISLAAVSCQKSSSDEPSAAANKRLFVSTGTCYSGSGITTYAQPQTGNQIVTFDSVTGDYQGSFLKMTDIQPVDANTTPVDMIMNGSNLLVLTENATAQTSRRILSVPLSAATSYAAFMDDQDAFTSVATRIMKSFAMETNVGAQNYGSVLVSNTTLVEKINPPNIRDVKGGANPWINSTGAAGNCMNAAVATPGIVDVGILPSFSPGVNGKMIGLLAGATTATNKLMAIQRTGMTTATAADCAGGTGAGATGLASVAHINTAGDATVTGPILFNAAGASPTAMVHIPDASVANTGKLLVAYSTPVNTLFDNNTNFNTGIVAWDVTETSDTAVTFTNPTIIYRNTSVVWAPSAMTYDSANRTLYVAVGGAPGVINQTTSTYGYSIEKFTLDLTTPASPILTRVPSTTNGPFFNGRNLGDATRCISSIVLEQ